VCSGKGGLKKKLTNTNEYVHPLCGLLEKSIAVEDVLRMSFSRQSPPQKHGSKCELCGHANAQFRCQVKGSCKAHIHMWCLVQKYKEAKVFTTKDGAERSSWEFYLEGPWDLEKVVLNEGSQTLPETIKNEATSIMRQYYDYEQEWWRMTSGDR
jgi:PHD-zinc-finger like domain